MKEQEAVAALRLAKEECDHLTARLAEQDQVVSALERDLVAAHQAVDAGKALIKCYNNKQSGDVFDAVIKEHEDKEKAKLQLQQQQTTIVVKANTVKGGGGVTSDGWGDDDLDVDTPVKPKARDHSEDKGHDSDVETGSGGRGTALVVLGGLDAGDRMLQAVRQTLPNDTTLLTSYPTLYIEQTLLSNTLFETRYHLTFHNLQRT